MDTKKILRDFAPKISICTYHMPYDPKVLCADTCANPNYVIVERRKKIYAYAPKT